MDSQTDSPMKAAYPAPEAGGGQGDFYGPNMPTAVGTNSPTPSSGVPSWVQFAPGGFSPGPMDSPFNTAISVGSTPAGGDGGGHADAPMSSPMNSGMPMSAGSKS